MLRTNNAVAIPLSVDHTCANPLEADDVKARCWDKTPIRPNIFGFNPTFINRGEESLTSTTSSLISRSSSLKAGSSGIMSQPPREYDISMHRVAGSLMVTRALGDHYLKSSLHSPPLFSSGCPYISCEPEVHWRVLQPQDMFALMGCDGIWDNVTNAEAIEIVTIALQNEALQPILEKLNKNLNELQTEGEDGGTDIGHDTGADTGADTGPEATKHDIANLNLEVFDMSNFENAVENFLVENLLDDFLRESILYDKGLFDICLQFKGYSAQP